MRNNIVEIWGDCKIQVETAMKGEDGRQATGKVGTDYYLWVQVPVIGTQHVRFNQRSL